MNMTATTLLLRAVAFATHKHRDQRRKDAGASPYINHPIALADEGGISDPTILYAAVLHDTVEDTDTSEAELAATFGPAIAAIVIEVTDYKALEKAERKRLQVAHAAHISREANLVKLVDKICNLRDILASPPADWPAARKADYFAWAGAVVDNLRGVHPGLEALFDAVHACSSELAN